MKKFAFIPGQVNKAYRGIISQYKHHDNVMDLVKVGGLFVFFLVCMFFYLYYVNLASTRGYFLKKENQEMNTISFQQEILKTRLIDYRQQNWDTIQSSIFQRKVVDISAEIVKHDDNLYFGFVQDKIE